MSIIEIINLTAQHVGVSYNVVTENCSLSSSKSISNTWLDNIVLIVFYVKLVFTIMLYSNYDNTHTHTHRKILQGFKNFKVCTKGFSNKCLVYRKLRENTYTQGNPMIIIRD